MSDLPAHSEEQIEARRQAVGIASAMLQGESSFLVGCAQLHSLLFKCRIPEHDPDHNIFTGVYSSTGHLPPALQATAWAPAALEQGAPEVAAAEAWARKQATVACEHIIARFVQPN